MDINSQPNRTMTESWFPDLLAAVAASLRVVLTPVAWTAQAIAAVGIVLMVLAIVGDVVLRGVIGMTFGGVTEVTGMLMVIVTFGGMAIAELRETHIRVTVLTSRISDDFDRAFHAALTLLAIAVLAIVTWTGFLEALTLIREGAITGFLRLPRGYFAAGGSLMMLIFLATNFVTLFETTADVFRRGGAAVRWWLVGIAIVIVVCLFAVTPSTMGADFRPTTIGGLYVGAMFVLIFLGLPIGAAMALITFAGFTQIISFETGTYAIGLAAQSISSNFIWSVIPLFGFLGLLAARMGLGRDIYTTAYSWLGHTPGGLASATIAGSGAFSAIVGDSTTGVLTMSSVAQPEMARRNYDPRLIAGSVCAGGALGILIPPSLGLLVYGILVEQSISRLFMAALIPGILMTVALIIFINIYTRVFPHMGPRGPRTSLRDKLMSLVYSWHVALLFALVLGGIYVGFFTPFEAAAVGVVAVLGIGLVTRRIRFEHLTSSLMEAVLLTAVIMFIFVFANALGQFLSLTQLPNEATEAIVGLHLPGWGLLASFLVFFFLLGCVMNVIPAMVLVVPLLFPSFLAAGFDPIWIGVLVTVSLEIGLLTPPIGMNVFALAAIQKDISMETIFRGVTPFWIVMLLVLAILAAFPEISLFLPNLAYGS